ncbi:MAG: hypothetical protein QOE44_217 [Solirubrobacteraceae bacterium]|jgi:hypothetical protein|nr:hypothetical protein [Solirubrobacteraceae bacterium]
MNASAGTRNQAVLVVAGGLAVGSLTSFGQTYLHGASAAFVNSASAWLILPFFIGAHMASRRDATAAGLAVCLLQLGGYYLTAQMRGFPAGGAILVFWAGCAVLGGPAYGAAGWLWRTGGPRVRGLGAAVLASAFLAEGLWVYLHELHRYATAALWITIGALLAATMARRVTEARWLALTVPIALAGEVLLTQVYSRAF